MQSDIGVTIDQAALDQALGGGTALIAHADRARGRGVRRSAMRRGEAQVVWTTLVADLETPVSAFLKIAPAAA